jgi:N4-gp56 family major capsid protein
MATNTLASNFSADAVSAYIAAKTLEVAKKHMVMYQVCEKAQQPKGEGRTFQYSRFERLSLPQSALTEGVTPSGSSMSLATVTAVMDQWGDFVGVSDVSIDSVKHPVLQMAIDRLGMQAQETLDREVTKVALSGGNVYFPNAISARGSLTTSDKASSALIGKIVSNLRSDGAMPYDGRNYIGVVDPFIEDDITNDSTFVDAAKYGEVQKLYNQEIGTWKGVRWLRSNTLPVLRLLASNATAATSATAGSLVASTAYDVSVTIVDAQTGFETHMGAKVDVSTAAGNTSIAVTLPALPTTAPAGSTFNIYLGADAGTRYLASSGNAASAVINVGSLPSSGRQAPAAAPSSIPVHQGIVLGKQGLACVELNKIKAYLTPAQPSDSDPLVQRRKAGWKADFKSVICNDDFLARMEVATTNS